MDETKKLFILAGEPSGDRIGADLVRRLRARHPFTLFGVGGDELAAVGLKSIFPMDNLSVMGVADVLRRLPLLLWRIEQCARAIMANAPDGVVLVDAQEFSLRLARRLRKLGYGSPILLYVAPSVWARAPERAKVLAPLFDEVMAVLPFEPGVMARLGGPPTHYVGHPALADLVDVAPNLDGTRIALLPGSRPGELRRHLPMLKSLVADLGQRHDIGAFFMPTLPRLAERLRAEVSSWSSVVEIVNERNRRAALYRETRLAIVTAGTATLEVALAGVPMVVGYVMEGAQARQFVRLGRPRVGLPNIILDADVTPEIITEGAGTGALLAVTNELLDDAERRAVQITAFERLKAMMENGSPEAVREDPADRVLAHLGIDPGGVSAR